MFNQIDHRNLAAVGNLAKHTFSGKKPADAHTIEPANQPIIMKPGGYHVMLMGLVKPLNPGETVEVTLSFESGETLTVDVPVKQRGKMMKHGQSHGEATN